jgi:cyanate permease
MSVEVKSVLKGKTWAMIIIFAVFMSFIGVLSAPFAPTWCWSILFGTATGPIVVLFITLIISKVSKRIFSPQILALLYATSSLSLAFCWSMVP